MYRGVSTQMFWFTNSKGVCEPVDDKGFSITASLEKQQDMNLFRK